MMNSFWGDSNDIFDRSYKVLRRGILIFGSFLTVLGILIFMFPALIAFIFASFILFVGISALVLGYRIWKLKNQARPFDWEPQPSDIDLSVENPTHYRRTITFIMR